MENEKCKIELDSPDNVYFSQQPINGRVRLILDKKTSIKGIKVCLIGTLRCKWIQYHKRPEYLSFGSNSPKRQLIYSTKECALMLDQYILGSKTANSVELNQGEYVYGFNFNLPSGLLSTVIGKYGSKKYKIKVTIHKPWCFDEKYEKPVIIVKINLPPTLNDVRPINIESQHIGIIGGGPIRLAAHLPFNYVVRGMELSVNATIDNTSNMDIDKIKFSIYQSIRYYRLHLYSNQRSELKSMVKKETGGVQKKSKRSFAYKLQIPNCLPSEKNLSAIQISYYVEVKIVLPGLYKNLIINLPFEVCSHERLPLNPGSSQPNTWIFPNVDRSTPNSSIATTDSPSHSLNLSETSSIDSTASDLSTMTVTPLSRNSGASTSSSVRSHFRNSIGFQIENLPMNNSYPPSRPGSFAYNDQTSSPRLAHQLSQPVRAQYSNELPPSYEELFGNISQTERSRYNKASAPPLSP